MSIHPAAVRPARIARVARRQSSILSPRARVLDPASSPHVFVRVPTRDATSTATPSRANTTPHITHHRFVPARWVNPPPNASPGRLSSSPPSWRATEPRHLARVLTPSRRRRLPRARRRSTTRILTNRSNVRARSMDPRARDDDACACDARGRAQTPDRSRSTAPIGRGVSARRRGRSVTMYARRRREK
jgi:hypothetical protein